MLCQSWLAGAGWHPQTSASQIPPDTRRVGPSRACHRRCAFALDPAASGPRLPSGRKSRRNPRANREADLCSRACRRRRECRQRGRRRRRNELRPRFRHRRRPFRAIGLRANQGIGGTSSAGTLHRHFGVEAQHRVRSRGSILQPVCSGHANCAGNAGTWRRSCPIAAGLRKRCCGSHIPSCDDGRGGRPDL